MSDNRPGFNPQRLLKLMQSAIQRCELDLQGKTVLTEAATGAYVVTPVLAAMAAAQHVFAITCTSGYGTVEEVIEQTRQLAGLARVNDRIEFVTKKSRDIVAQADIITNSGHVRPIDAEMIGWMKPTAVISLMYEAWEFRPDDVNLAACRERGIPVVGTNECHPSVDVFSFLGIMAVKLLLDAGIGVYNNRVLVLCDNPFRPYLMHGLQGAGACVDFADNLLALQESRSYDTILVALQPRSQPIIGGPGSLIPARLVAGRWPGALVTQFWGDLDRGALAAERVPYWPLEAPAAGHLGILPSAIGPEPVVRLQAGGLKVGEILANARAEVDRVDCAVASGYAQPITYL